MQRGRDNGFRVVKISYELFQELKDRVRLQESTDNVNAGSKPQVVDGARHDNSPDPANPKSDARVQEEEAINNDGSKENDDDDNEDSTKNDGAGAGGPPQHVANKGGNNDDQHVPDAGESSKKESFLNARKPSELMVLFVIYLAGPAFVVVLFIYVHKLFRDASASTQLLEQSSRSGGSFTRFWG